jgi:DNA-binding MarR family transcriptional regulator
MHYKTTDDISLSEYQALAEIRYQIRRFLAFSERMARAAGLESQQHQALLALKGLPEGKQATVSYLAERLQLQHHSTVELVNRLAENNYVQRRRDEVDQRRVIVELTERGEEILRELTLAHRDELQLTGPALVRALNAVVAPDAHQASASRDEDNETRKVRH